MEIKAVIVGTASKTMSKSNGAEYVLMNCEILEGPAKGKIVAGTRTTINQDGLEKSIPEVGQEVVLHHRAVESTAEAGKYVHFFEIQAGLVTADNDELSALLGVGTPSTQTI